VRGRLALLGASLVLSLALAEVGLRRVRPQWAVVYPPTCFWPQVFQRWDPYGYRLWPSRTMTYRSWVNPPIEVTSNAEGFRGHRDLAATGGGTRIVVLGDSMVFGPGVAEAERFTERVEAAVPGWRVDNMGMIGFGTDLMLRALEAVGLDPPPAAVVLAVFTDDLRRVVPWYQGAGFPLPRFVLEDGRLVSVPYPAPRVWDRSRILQGIRYLRWRYTPATFALNAAILERFLADARSSRFAPALLFLPGPRDGWDDRMRRRWLRGWAGEHGVPFLDLTDTVARAGGAALYLPHDTHWSSAGHRAVADALAPFLAREVLPAAGGLPSAGPPST